MENYTDPTGSLKSLPKTPSRIFHVLENASRAETEQAWKLKEKTWNSPFLPFLLQSPHFICPYSRGDTSSFPSPLTTVPHIHIALSTFTKDFYIHHFICDPPCEVGGNVTVLFYSQGLKTELKSNSFGS